jgi:hypothetical protein
MTTNGEKAQTECHCHHGYEEIIIIINDKPYRMCSLIQIPDEPISIETGETIGTVVAVTTVVSVTSSGNGSFYESFGLLIQALTLLLWMHLK